MINCGKNSILYLRSVFNLSFRNCSYWTTFDGMLSAHMFKVKVEATQLLPFIYDNQLKFQHSQSVNKKNCVMETKL